MERGAEGIARDRLPPPRVLAVCAVVLLPFVGLWVHGRAQRAGIESRAAAVAGEIAGRPVGVRCPGPFRRHLMYEITEGSVRFDADGRPLGTTKLSARTCDGLRTAMDAGASLDLDCLAYACDGRRTRAAAALAVLAHEAVHLRGVVDEGATECEAHAHIAFVARSYGLTDRATESLRRWQATDWMEGLPERYQAC